MMRAKAVALTTTSITITVITSAWLIAVLPWMYPLEIKLNVTALAIISMPIIMRIMFFERNKQRNPSMNIIAINSMSILMLELIAPTYLFSLLAKKVKTPKDAENMSMTWIKTSRLRKFQKA